MFFSTRYGSDYPPHLKAKDEDHLLEVVRYLISQTELGFILFLLELIYGTTRLKKILVLLIWN